MEAHFKSRTPEVRYEFVDYPGEPARPPLSHSPNLTHLIGTVHGFAARPVMEQPLSVEGQEKALEQAVKWFQSTL